MVIIIMMKWLGIIIPIDVTDAGIIIDVMGQARYALGPILVLPAGMVTDVTVCIVYRFLPGLEEA